MSVHEQGLHALIGASTSSDTPSPSLLDEATQKVVGLAKKELLPWAIGGIVLTVFGVAFTSWLICHRTGGYR